jgi:hypothetical protein
MESCPDFQTWKVASSVSLQADAEVTAKAEWKVAAQAKRVENEAEARQGKLHSVRKACNGSMREARRAGP